MRRISRNQADDPQKAGVRIATMYRVKEGEFKVVFISALDADSFPFVIEADDAPQRKAWLNQEKALFYVAASRATDLLFFSANGQWSVFMHGLAAHITDN